MPVSFPLDLLPPVAIIANELAENRSLTPLATLVVVVTSERVEDKTCEANGQSLVSRQLLRGHCSPETLTVVSRSQEDGISSQHVEQERDLVSVIRQLVNREEHLAGGADRIASFFIVIALASIC